MRIREALAQSLGRLDANHIPNPRLTSEVLLAHCLGVEREYLISHDDRELNTFEEESFRSAVLRRISGVPVQYITGWQEFYGYSFKVSPAVLIPRPETENIIDAVLETDPRQGVRIVDVGTGSGCIAITLAKEIEGAHVFAGDISEDALRVAKFNARNLDTSVRFVCMDLLEGIEGEFDFVVSNPPYVPPDDLANVQREVREHEPHVALFSSGDFMSLYRRIIASANERLRSGGYLIMEIGLGMEEGIGALLGSEWLRLPTKSDLQGIPRTIVARKN